MNIITIENGLEINESHFIFDGEIEIISESQCHAPTSNGVILLDLSCSVNDLEYTDINLFVKALKGY
jgi:hypothetical protein